MSTRAPGQFPGVRAAAGPATALRLRNPRQLPARTLPGLALCIVLSACSGGGTLGDLFPKPPPGITVTVTPDQANVAAGGTLQFSAEVAGTSDTSVTWQVFFLTGGNAASGTISASGLYVAPAAAVSTVLVTAVSPTGASGDAQVTVLAPHRFGVRPTSGNAEFYDRATGGALTPRGNNYTRLANQTDPGGNPVFSHAAFSVGLYDPVRSETALAQMQASGYNLVIIPTTGCCEGTLGDPNGGLSQAYVANIVDFLMRAKAHGIAVVPAFQWLPAYGGFTQLLDPCGPAFGDINLVVLSSCGVQATRRFFQQFVQALIADGAPMDAIFAYEVWDEVYFNVQSAPLDAASGSVTTANAQTYDMGSTASRQQMMADGLSYFGDQVRAAIVALDPTAMVTMSFFPPQQPNPTRPGDPRIIQVYPAMAGSALDYLDLHMYPVVFDMTLAQTVENFGFAGYQARKPVLMGEFGAFVSAYPAIADAASALQSWQVQSCAYDVKGWALWTWDTDEQPELWNARSQDGVIDAVLAPAARPDPCS
jgi:hypothetical protein